MQTYSNDLRSRIFEARQSGETTAEVAERFGVCGAFVRRLCQRFRESGSLAPLPHGGGPTRKLADHEEALRQAVREHPDATPAEHRERLTLPASRVTVWRAMRRLGLTRKKKSVRASEQDRPDVAEARREWPSKRAGVSPEDLVFVDETGATTTMQRTHGYGPRGERVVAAAPFKRWRGVTFIGALSSEGMVAPWALEGAINGEWFAAYVRQVLAPGPAAGNGGGDGQPALPQIGGDRRGDPEGGLPAGIPAAVQPRPHSDRERLLEAQAEGKLRDWAARTTQGVYEALREIVPRFQPAECLNYLRHCGYPAATAA